MMNRYDFFSLAYSNVPPILSIIEKLYIKNLNINIVVHIESHRLFWQDLIKHNNVKWKLIFLNTDIKGSLKNPLSWIRIRKHINLLFKKNFQSVCDSHIYFFSSSFALMVFALIKLLAKRNRLYFIDCDKRVYPEWYNLKNIGKWFLMRLLYRVDIKIVKIGDRAAPTLSKHFFEKAKVQRIGEREDFYDTEVLRKYNPINGEITFKKKIVLLDDDCWMPGYSSSEDIYKMLDILKKIIETNFSKSEILFKRHPNPQFHTTDYNSIYKDYSEYPYYVPADFIFLEPNIKFVIGRNSTVLPIASLHHGVKAISYLRLVPFQDERFKNRLIEILKKESSNEIVFPNSWDALSYLLSRK